MWPGVCKNYSFYKENNDRKILKITSTVNLTQTKFILVIVVVVEMIFGRCLFNFMVILGAVVCGDGKFYIKDINVSFI